MKFGINFTPVYPAEMASVARVAEDVGFESLWIGEAALRRTVELGDGWFGGSPSPEHAAVIIADLQRRRAEAERPRLEITLLTAWSQGYEADLVAQFESVGVDRLVVTPWTSSRAVREGVEQFAEVAGLS